MNRVLVIGNCGAGKSEAASRLGKKTGLPVIHLDEIFWLPGWVERDQAEFDILLDAELSKDQWIMDGNYNRTLEKRLHRADTVIFLDYSRFICLWRVFKRWIRDRNQKIDYTFLRYVFFDYYQKNRPRAMAQRCHFQNVRWIVLKSPARVAEYLVKV